MLVPVFVQAVVFIPLGLSLALIGTTVSGLALPLVGASLIVGAVVTFVSMAVTDPTLSTTKVDAPLLVQINPADPLPTPSGWTAAVSPATAPSPPSTATALTFGGTTLVRSGTLCTEMTNSTYANLTNGSVAYRRPEGGTFPAGATWTHVASCTVSGFPNGSVSDTPKVCPVGYSWNGSACALSDATVVQKPSDGKCTIKRTGNSFGVDTLDPDCAADNGTIGRPATLLVEANIIQAQVSATVKQKVELNASTGATIVTKITQNPNGTTTTEVTNVSNANGINTAKITGQATTTVTGTGDLAGTTPLAPVIEFPTDYNKEATQAQIKAGIDVMKDTSGLPATDLAAAKNSYDVAKAEHSSKIEGITESPLNNRGIVFSWSPWIPQTTCFEPVMNFLGRSVTLTWCVAVLKVREIAGWAFFLLTAFAIYRMVVLRKE